MRPVTVALVASSYAPIIGGVESHVAQVARGLLERGHHVEVWTVDRSGGSSGSVVDGVRVRYLPTPLPARSVKAVVRFVADLPRAWREWVRAFRSLQPDIVHVHCFGPNGVYADLLRRRFDRPMIVTSHGETLADDRGAYQRSTLLRRALTRAIHAAAAVTAPSAFVLDDLRRGYGLGAGLGSVIPNGVDLSIRADRTAQLPAARGSYLTAVGRLGHMKGFDLLLNAFARAGIDDGIGLVIAGDGTERDSLVAQVERLAIRDRVSFPGALSPQSVANVMDGAMAVVVPSRAEAFGIVALEAWRAGAAVVMTNRSGAADFMTDGQDALLVDPEDEIGFARILFDLTRDAGLRARLAGNGTRRVQEFTWRRVVDAYDALYGSVTAAALARP
jgi:glycosyltransferase involved in cell wall biosynthesis